MKSEKTSSNFRNFRFGSAIKVEFKMLAKCINKINLSLRKMSEKKASGAQYKIVA